MVRSFVLFTHIVGIMFFSAGLGLEWAQRRWPTQPKRDEALRTGLSSLKARIYPVAGGVVVLSGIGMTTAEGLWAFSWIWLALATIVVMVVADHRVGSASLYFRTAIFLGVVYLMIGKPDLVPSLVVMVVASIVGAAATLGQSWPVASRLAHD
jgi:hypothetical protein